MADALDDLLNSLADRIADQVFQRLAKLNESDRLAYSETEAAKLIGLEPRQLADERRDGRIAACRVRQNRVRYLRSDLIAYLNDRRMTTTN